MVKKPVEKKFWSEIVSVSGKSTFFSETQLTKLQEGKTFRFLIVTFFNETQFEKNELFMLSILSLTLLNVIFSITSL